MFEKNINDISNGDLLLPIKELNKSKYLDLYTYQLKCSIDWIDDNGALRDDSPLSIDDIHLIVDMGNELINITFDNAIKLS
jgi:hypothetical protein